ncbi:MAG TPA: hypothetical protein VN034_00715 [Sphingopyxis sp.]|nr:hypothetical protein [Sphingopyxis sp.]
MPAAVIGGVIAGAGAIGGAALSSKAQKKAASTAANAQLDATAQNNALAREQYGLNQAALAPWQQRGNAAGTAVNALLGIGQTVPANNNTPAAQAAATAAQKLQYDNAFKNFQKSTGYQFRLGEGQRALNTGFAGKGALNSGAAMKAMATYGQNLASGEFGSYMNALTGVSNQGLSAANAQAGVGTNLVNAVSNNNNLSAGALGNQAFANANAQGQLWGAAGNALGNIGSAFASSFGGGNSLNAASQRLIAANPNIF